MPPPPDAPTPRRAGRCSPSAPSTPTCLHPPATHGIRGINRLVAEAGEALGLGLALRLALGLALLVAGLLVLLVVLEADDADLAAQRAVAPERRELLAAGRAVVARAAALPAPLAPAAATAARAVLARRRRHALDLAHGGGGEA